MARTAALAFIVQPDVAGPLQGGPPFLIGTFCSLFLGVAVFFRNKLWLTIVFTFFFGMMLYPAASVATLGSTIGTVLIALTAGVAGAAVIGAVSGFILNHRGLT
jgi:hypothetical protein